jgi:predicted  nucleic acid-binding Zn-ribbon protein
MDDYTVLMTNIDDSGTILYGCSRCGIVVFDKLAHDTAIHPVAKPFDGEDDVDLDDDIPADEDLPDEPEEDSNPTPEMVVITP